MNIIILGASSAIAQNVAKKYATSEVNFILVARDIDKLAIIEKDLLVIGVKSVATYILDFNDFNAQKDFINYLTTKNISIDIVLFSYGIMHQQQDCINNIDNTIEQIHSNYNSVVVMIAQFCNIMIPNKKGVIAVVTSVAGDRGRKSNYIYGSAKAGVSVYLAGLYAQLLNTGVSIVDLKPGFINTPMTSNCKKGLLWTNADVAAEYIVKAIQRKKRIAYIPSFWFLIMLIIRFIPNMIFKKLNF